MEIIIFVAVIVVAALLWSGYVKTKKAESDQTIGSPSVLTNPGPMVKKLLKAKFTSNLLMLHLESQRMIE
jgi:hypothetical protein